jgi:hypothetical protein
LLFADVVPAYGVNGDRRSPEHRPVTDSLAAEAPTADPTAEMTAEKLGTAAAHAAIEEGWAQGLSVRETAKRATRAPSYVHGVFVRLDEERGPRPASDRPGVSNGRDEPDAAVIEPTSPEPSPVATP